MRARKASLIFANSFTLQFKLFCARSVKTLQKTLLATKRIGNHIDHRDT